MLAKTGANAFEDGLKIFEDHKATNARVCKISSKTVEILIF